VNEDGQEIHQKEKDQEEKARQAGQGRLTGVP
jgi:hypothetical protein